MPEPMDYSFARYLAAKRTVDDRALNYKVAEVFKDMIVKDSQAKVLEVGGGIGTMLIRLLGWDVLRGAHYSLLDLSRESVEEAGRYVPEQAKALGFSANWNGDELLLADQSRAIIATFEAANFYSALPRRASSADVLIAHAFLDLLHLPTALPVLFSALKPGGLFYFTVNYDGEMAFEPLPDPALDAHIIELYHRTMDARIKDGRPSGDRYAGRHLFRELAALDAQVLAAGSSDWVVFSADGRYPADEAYFLHFIIHMVERALAGHSELEEREFVAWIAARHAQIERGELVYVAHQLDFLGRAAQA